MNSKILVIEKENLAYNLKKLREDIKVQIIAVLKGNGYGLSLIDYARFLKDNEINFFAVSEIDEAVALKENFEDNVLLLTPTFDVEEIENLINLNVILTASSLENAKLYDQMAMNLNKEVKVHIKIDTGFGRFGFNYENKEELIKVFNLQYVEVQGIYSHFSASFEKNYKITKLQFEKFNEVIKYLKERSIEPKMKHIANSCAALRFKETHFDAVRLGSAIIGRLPISNSLKKVAYLESKVLEIKELPADHNIGYANTHKMEHKGDVAIIPVGYKDGYMVEKSKDTFRFMDILRYMFSDFKSLFKKNFVIIGDKTCRVIGRVGMYNIVADVTNMDIKAGDIVKLPINPLFVDSNIKREFR